MSSETKNTPYVAIKPLDKGVEVHWRINILQKQKDSGKISCFIPSLDILFSANDVESAKIKTQALSTMFFDHFFIHSKNGLKKLALQLHKLGYKAHNDAYTIHKLANNVAIPAKFKIKDAAVPNDFKDAINNTFESRLEITL